MNDGLAKFLNWVKATWADPGLSMRQLLAMLVLAIALPLLVLTSIMFQGMAGAERRAVRDGLMTQARALASLIDNEIDKHIVLAGTLAASQALRDGDLARFERQARQALGVVPGAWLNLSTPDGRFIMSTLQDTDTPLPPRGSLDLLKMAWATRQPQVSDVVMGPISKRRNAFIEYPVFNNDAPLYSIVIGLDPDRFLALLRGKGNDGAVLGIVDRKHYFVARVPDHEARVGTLAAEGWRREMQRVSEGFSEAPVLEGELSLTAFSATRAGWTVGVAYAFKTLEAPINRILWPFGVFATLVTLASLGLGASMARQISRSTRALKKSAFSLGGDAFVEPLLSPIREVTEIGDALRATSQELSARQADIRSNEDRLRRARDTFFNLVQHAPFGLYLVDSKLRIIQVSAGAERAFATVDQLLGHDLSDALRTLWPEPFATEATDRFRHTLATGESFHQLQMQETRRDINQDEAYDWQIERVTLPDGEQGVVCYFYNLTEQKRTEAALRESEVFARTVLDASPDCIKVGTFDGRLEYLNQNGICLLEIDDSKAVVGRHWEALWPQSQRATITQAIAAAEKGNESRFESEAPTFKGPLRTWDVTVGPVRNSAGRPIKFIASSRDVTEKKKTELAVRENEMRFRGTFENAAVGVAHVGLDGRWIEVNQRLCAIVGYTRDELLGRPLLELTHPDDIAADQASTRLLLAGDIPSYNVEKRLIRKDQSFVWIELTVALRRDAAARPLYFISIIRDITGLKEAQEQQAFLQRELAHRLKNQLAVIHAMTGQTARSAKSVQELRASLSQRIHGLAVGTDLLIQQNWAGANLSDLVERQLRTFCPSNDRMMCEGPAISLGPDAVQAIGLALHELATNAVKHGAWSSAAGTVIVSWSVRRDASAAQHLQVMWREKGGPAVAEPTRKGFGRVVIETMVAQKLSGTVEIAFPPEGFAWTLSLPSAQFSQVPPRAPRDEAKAQFHR